MNIDISRAWTTLQAMINGFIAALPNIVLALISFIFFYIAAKGISSLVGRLGRRGKRHRNVGLVLGRLAQWSTLFIGLLVSLSIIIPTFRAGDLIELLGIGGVAIGFAFRDILQNFLAGILLLLTEPFRVEDQIRVGDFEGTVEEIQTRATMIKTYDGRRVVIPNSDLFTDKVIVNTAYDKRRVEYDIGIGYGDDIERSKRLILSAVDGVEGVLKDPPPEALVYDFAASTINIRARWWIDPPLRKDVLETRDRVLESIKKTFAENGIDLPFPTQQILFHDQTEEADGDRSRQREGWPTGGGDDARPRSIAASIRNLSQPVAQRDEEK
jgi:small conductance mechanosensitive channel